MKENIFILSVVTIVAILSYAFINKNNNCQNKAVQNSADINTIKVGDKVADFTLPNALDKPVTLYDELKKGPVVITWYRGGWCPICNLTLHELQEYLPEIQANGANLIAISPETPDESISFKEKNELKFEVLSDSKNKVAKQLGIIDEKSSKGRHGEVPLPATIIVNKEGIVTYTFIPKNYRKRAEPEEIIVELKKL